MKLTFCGAAGTTTGSQHLIEVNGNRILLDCGLYQGKRQNAYEINCNFPYFDPSSIDSVVLSHAHIDHSGNLPNLCKKGFQGNIYTTFATRDLCQVMLADSAHIQESDTKWLNKHLVRRGEPTVEPLYNAQDADKCLEQFINIGYQRPIPVAQGVKATFFDAGHILGSAQILLDIDDQEDNTHKRLLFSGDVGRGNNDLLRNPAPVEDIDFLLMESTYGGREHTLGTRPDERIARILKKAIQRGGKIIIPCFAVERTQQLLYVLHELFEKKAIPEIPVYVDSPLAVNATEIFRLHPECFNKEVYNFLYEKRNPFGFEGLTLIRSVKKSKELNADNHQAIIISASGMCEAGRILHHLRNGISDKRNTILFVGYCAENTLGAKIRNGETPVNIFGEPHDVHAQVEIMDSFSGHADHSELLEYFQGIGGAKKHIWLVHGEPSRSQALQEALQALHNAPIDIAKIGTEVHF